MVQDPSPQEALASIQAARNSVSSDIAYPLWYDAIYGGACGLLVASQGMPQPWSLIALPIALGGLALMMASWRKKFGWWVSGYSPRRARWVAFALVPAFLGLMGLSLYGRFVGPWWLFIVSGVIGFVVAIAASRLWMRVWRQELAEGLK